MVKICLIKWWSQFVA